MAVPDRHARSHDPDRGYGPYPPTIADSCEDGLLPRMPVYNVTKHLHQGIESDHFRVIRALPRMGGFRSFHTARRRFCGFEAVLRPLQGRERRFDACQPNVGSWRVAERTEE